MRNLYENKICVLEYPRSGGNWTLKMLSEYLGMHYRDLDRRLVSFLDKVRFNLFCIPKIARFNKRKYLNPFNYLIKTHVFSEYNFKKVVYNVRDGRDVFISYYFHEKKFNKENIFFEFNNKEFDCKEFLDYLICRSSPKLYPFYDWKSHVLKAKEAENYIFAKYEDLYVNANSVLVNLVTKLGFKVELNKINKVVEDHSFDKEKAFLISKKPELASHLRRGLCGGWKEYFNEEHKRVFKEYAGELLIDLGYETDYKW